MTERQDIPTTTFVKTDTDMYSLRTYKSGMVRHVYYRIMIDGVEYIRSDRRITVIGRMMIELIADDIPKGRANMKFSQGKFCDPCWLKYKSIHGYVLTSDCILTEREML